VNKEAKILFEEERAMETKHAVRHTDDQRFDAEVLNADRPVLVDFWAPWCGPCRAIGPILEELADEYGGRLDVVKVNVDENPVTAGRYGVRSIPTLLLIKGGEVQETRVGMLPKDKLADLISRNLA
jgi:thioredoxin 1